MNLILQSVYLAFALFFTGMAIVKYALLIVHLTSLRASKRSLINLDRYGALTTAIACINWALFYYLSHV